MFKSCSCFSFGIFLVAVTPGCSGSSGTAAQPGGASGGMQTTSSATGGAGHVSGGASSGATGGTINASGGTGLVSGGASSATGGTQTVSGGSSAQGCPDSSAYIGNNTWQQQLEVKAGADYCAGWRESRTLEQELAAKAKLHIAAGKYALPDATGSYPFALPVCFEFPGGAAAPSFAGPGQITLTQSTRAPNVYITDRIKQPLSLGASTSWSFQGSLSLRSTVGVQPAPLVLDGSGLVGAFAENSTFQGLQLCSSEACAGAVSDLGFDSCNPETYTLYRSTVTFDGGQAIFDVRIQSLPGGISESPVFVLATGTLDAVAFEQRDYWKLVYSASHHQFSRSFAVLFDSPINGACGIKVTSLDPYNGAQPPQVYTIHCDLSNIAQRSTTTVVTERP